MSCACFASSRARSHAVTSRTIGHPHWIRVGRDLPSRACKMGSARGGNLRDFLTLSIAVSGRGGGKNCAYVDLNAGARNEGLRNVWRRLHGVTTGLHVATLAAAPLAGPPNRHLRIALHTENQLPEFLLDRHRPVLRWWNRGKDLRARRCCHGVVPR